MTEKKVRVRFAPSPTGPLHIGGVRTALYNYLFAKKYNGDFILRIEDTDQTRFVEGAEQYIIDAFNWCGIEFTEGVSKGGKYGPYKQSERKEIYKQFALQLVQQGDAYYAFDSVEELDKMRAEFEAQQKTFTYNAEVRDRLNNSLNLSEQEVQKRINENAPYVIRFKMPDNEIVSFSDVVRGEVSMNSNTLDDKVLFKSDGMPTYHLANVVDDYSMKISHVIRGEEWLPSTPLHILLYRSLGWVSHTPLFVHIPLTLKPSGKGKLSKRDGDLLGFPVFPLQWNNTETGDVYAGFREAGYFPEAFINILALLGWNPGTEQEIFSIDELIQAFSLEKIGKSGSRFDPEKATWFNHQYLITKSDEELAELYWPILKEKGVNTDFAYVQSVCRLIKERANFVSEFWDQSFYFFEAPTTYDEVVIKKKWKEETPSILVGVMDMVASIEPFDRDHIEHIFKAYLEERQIGFGQVMNALRLTLVGSGQGPDLFTVCALLGKAETVSRIQNGLHIIQKIALS